MDPLSRPGLIPIGDSPNSWKRSNRSQRRAGSLSFSNIGRKTPQPMPVDSTSFPLEDVGPELQEKLNRKSSSSSLKSPGMLSFKIKYVIKGKENEILGNMKFETERGVVSPSKIPPKPVSVVKRLVIYVVI